MLLILQKIKYLSQKTANFAAAAFIPSELNDYLPKALSRGSLFACAAALLIIKAGLLAFFLWLPQSSYFSAIVSQDLLSLINRTRAEHNLQPLSYNSQLNSAAQMKASDMLANDYFEHNSPAGVKPWHWFKQAGYSYEWAGENLAMDFWQTDDVFTAWMNSPGHRANILNSDFTEIGLAVKDGQLQNHNSEVAVLMFGKPVQSSVSKTDTAAASPKPKTSAAPAKTPSPKPSAVQTPAPTPAAPSVSPQTSQKPLIEPGIAFNISALEDNNEPASSKTQTPAVAEQKYVPKVLGAFASKSDEIAKSIYLYFTLFLTIALAVNILVKISIQRWNSILAATLLVALSAALCFM